MAARCAAANEAADPEAELAELFVQEAQLVRQLADVRRSLDSTRQRYGAQQGFMVLPSYEALRARLAPQGRQ